VALQVANTLCLITHQFSIISVNNTCLSNELSCYLIVHQAINSWLNGTQHSGDSKQYVEIRNGKIRVKNSDTVTRFFSCFRQMICLLKMTPKSCAWLVACPYVPADSRNTNLQHSVTWPHTWPVLSSRIIYLLSQSNFLRLPASEAPFQLFRGLLLFHIYVTTESLNLQVTPSDAGFSS
jgi:hypothetical protein